MKSYQLDFLCTYIVHVVLSITDITNTDRGSTITSIKMSSLAMFLQRRT